MYYFCLNKGGFPCPLYFASRGILILECRTVDVCCFPLLSPFLTLFALTIAMVSCVVLTFNSSVNNSNKVTFGKQAAVLIHMALYSCIVLDQVS